MSFAKDPESESPLKFPCSFPIKVMGRHEGDFKAMVLAMISGHVGEIAPGDVRSRESSSGRFVSVTVTVNAQSREQLDDVYRTLTASEHVLFVL